MAKGRKLGKEKTARLTEDLIVEILVKLPVKTLLRFRCVCKSWYDLIKNPYFIERHLIKNQVTSTENNSILIFHGRHLTSSLLSYHSYESLSVISPHFEIPYFSELFLEISGTCNGLLCMSNGETIVLCNPAMREFKLLPPRPFPCPEGYGVCISPIGLGFDSSTNDYKVVAFVHLLQDGGWNHIDKVEIYNLSTNSWREIEHQHDLTEMATASGASFNGALHWIAQRKGDTPSSRGSNFVLCFDMSNEVFRDMELPDDQLVLPQSPLVLPDGQMFNRGKLKSLVVLNALAMFAYTDAFYDFELCFEIWVMHEYGIAKSWTKQVRIGPLPGILRPLLFWKNEAIIIETSERRLISFALDTREINRIDIRGSLGSHEVMVYQESLISIK